MKRIFTLLFTVLSITAIAQTPFLPTSVVVYRVGDGAAPLRGVSTKVFLDEYSPTGTLIQSIGLPTAASGANLALTATGSSSSEGLMTLSVDGKYLVFGGYNTDTGFVTPNSTSASSLQRVIGRIDGLAVLNTSTSLGTSGFSTNNIRGVASVNGTEFYISGSGSGVRRAVLGDTTSTRISSSAALYASNYRAIAIFNNQIFVTSTSGNSKGLLTVGTGLPTDTGNVVTAAPGFPTTGSPYQFFFADLSSTIPGLDVVYVADDGASGGIQKYSFDGTNWVSNGSVLPATTGTRGLAGIVTGTTVALVTTAGGSKLYSLIDPSGYNQPITASFTEMATAPANTAFRGVALAPTTGIVPLKLVSFKALLLSDKSNLTWTANNEMNVRHYIVERSGDGKNYTALTTVNALNRNEASYSFADQNLLEGVNYYRLKMVDNNEKFTYSTVVSVINRKSVKTEIYPNPANNNITVSHIKAAPGATIIITNVDGQQLKTATVVAGSIQTNITIDNLVRGHYIVVFNNNGEKNIARFMKQ